MIDITYRMAQFRDKAEKIMAELILPQARAIDRNGEIPLDIMAALWEAGFLGLSVPRKWEGVSASVLEQALIIEWLSRSSASIGQRLLIQSLGLFPLLYFGSDEQKARFFKEIFNGRKLAAFALSEPEIADGSGETVAVRRDDHYLISGRKVFVSSGEQADLITVFSATDEENKLKSGISAYIIQRGTAGMMIGEVMDRAGLRGVPTTELVFKDCKVPADQRLGDEGQGYAIAESALTATAPLAAAHAVGLAQAAFELTLEKARGLNHTHSMASESQPMELALAEMSTRLSAARALTYAAARAWDWNKPDAGLLCRQAKVFASDTALFVTRGAIQCLGNYAMIRHHPLEVMLRDAQTIQMQLASNLVHEINIAREILKKV